MSDAGIKSDAQIEITFAQREEDLAKEIDWFLQTLVHLVNKEVMWFGITLSVGGTLISGTLISGKKYFETLAEDMARGFEVGEHTAKMVSLFRKNVKMIGQDVYDKSSESNEGPHAFPVYIHLENVFIYSPGVAASSIGGSQIVPIGKLPLWRGKLSSIDGYMIGQLELE